MTEPTNAATAPRATLSDAELQALAYFAVGVASEGSIGGRDVSHRLSFAGNIQNNVMHPVANSGYSIGTIQTDLGAHPEVATALVTAYQTWANEHQRDWVLTAAQVTQTANDLGRNGSTIRAQHGRDLDPTIKSHLNSFLASDAGITFVHDRDVAQINTLLRDGGAMDQLRETTLYRNSTVDDQARLATIMLKLENQSGRGYYPRIITSIQNGTCNSVDDVRGAVNRLLPNRDNKPDYVESGSIHALHGTEVFIALRNSNEGNPLRQHWQDVLANPLVNPTRTAEDPNHPSLPSQYSVVKNLYMRWDEAPNFVSALDRGGAYGYDVTDRRGRHHPQSTHLYAAGNDFVALNANGAGKAFIDGVWGDIERNDLARARYPDGSIDLNIRRDGVTERLLHVDPNAPLLRPTRAAVAELQQELRQDVEHARDAQHARPPQGAPHAPAHHAPAQPHPAANDHGAPPQRAPGGGHAQAFPAEHRSAPLFEAIRRQMPEGTSIEQTAFLTLKARESGIREPDQVGRVVVQQNQAWVAGTTPGFLAKADLSVPAPPLSETLRQVEQLDQQQAAQGMERQQMAMAAPGVGGRGMV